LRKFDAYFSYSFAASSKNSRVTDAAVKLVI
jgi:hypothetical protein